MAGFLPSAVRAPGRYDRIMILDSETKAVELPEDHGNEIRLWLRLLTCTTLIEGEVRSHDPALLAAQTAHLVDAVQLAAGLAGIDVEVTVRAAFTGFALADDALPVRIACAALRELGIEPHVTASGGGSDVNVYNAGGLPSVNLSVGMELVHTPDEYLPVERLDDAYRLLHALLRAAATATR